MRPKGFGEIPSINTPPAICNAIYNAVGVRVYATPVDQDAPLPPHETQAMTWLQQPAESW